MSFDHVNLHVAALHTTLSSDMDVLRRFWALEQPPAAPPLLSPVEQRKTTSVQITDDL